MPVPAIVPFLAGAGVIGGGLGIRAWYKARKRKQDQLGSPAFKPLPPGEPSEPGDGGQPGDASDAAAAAEVIKPYLGSYDHAAFHTPEAGDSVAKVARRVLTKLYPGATDQQVAAMRRALSMSAYNRQIAGCPAPAGYFNPGGVNVNAAFSPKHEGIDVLAAGYMPRRNIDQQCKRVGPSQKWAPLWVPQVNVNALRNGSTDDAILFGGTWADGSATLEPPPAFWDSAVKRPTIGS